MELGEDGSVYKSILVRRLGLAGWAEVFGVGVAKGSRCWIRASRWLWHLCFILMAAVHQQLHLELWGAL